MTIDPSIVIFGLGSVATMGVSWGAARSAISSAKAQASEVKADLKEHEKADEAKDREVVQRLTRIETISIALAKHQGIPVEIE